MTNEELRQEIEKLEQQIKDLKVKLESKPEPIPTSYQVKIPVDLENYYTIDIDGSIDELYRYTNEIRVLFYLRGLAFKTKTEAEQHLKKSMLLFKMRKWAEEHNGGWTPDWKNQNEAKVYVVYYFETKILVTKCEYYGENFTKLSYFKSIKIAQQFIEEFGDEIKEVLL